MSISNEDRKTLVTLARSAVAAEVSGQEVQYCELSGVLAERRGCFVTLTSAGRLRGCIGTFQPSAPLGEMVVEMGRAAANDPRFVSDPITAAEVDELKVEVSVLSELVETDEPEKLRVGTDGIFVVSGSSSGCFLPEVATDQGWDAQEFLSQCCAGKAGMVPDAWRQSYTKVYLFTSEKFSG